MITYLYAVKDSKSGYDKIFSSLNDAYANRDFSIACKDTGSLFNQFPSDFSLYCLGSVDTKTGDIVPDNRLICSASDVLGGVEVVPD